MKLKMLVADAFAAIVAMLVCFAIAACLGVSFRIFRLFAGV